MIQGTFKWIKSIGINSIPAKFDPELYLLVNQDVKSAGMDPYTHYKLYGKNEGRSIAPEGIAPAGWSYKSITDDEFRVKFIWAADIYASWLRSRHSDNKPLRILEFGCGMGIMALGLALRYGYEVTGVDIVLNQQQLELQAQKQLGLRKLPENLSLIPISPGDSLKKLGHFDAIINWSVFEHVDVMLCPGIIADFYEILSPDGVLFIQISPLWLSPFGSHLDKFITEPWAHLLYDRDTIRSKALSEQQPPHFHLSLDNKQSFDQARDYMLGEFDKLNRIRADDLVKMLKAGGFHIVREERNQVQLEPPEQLLVNYSLQDLKTNEIRILLNI